VRLIDGRLVWCNVNLNMRDNITTRPGAQRVVDGLLAKMLTTANMSPHAPASEVAAPTNQPPSADEPSAPPPKPSSQARPSDRPVDQHSDEEAP
jgi:hypothetical protein